MQTRAFETPVALFVFKRPGTTRQVFDVISKVRPTKLMLVGDGPRQDRDGEVEACRKVRNIVAQVDWPCEVITNFSDVNLGCGERMISGLNWVFSFVEEAIILEDDCVPDLSFFPFCRELLERYRGDARIAYISGSNLVQKHKQFPNSYGFSRIGGIWGWATWKSEWQRYDRHLVDWTTLRKEQVLDEVFDNSKVAKYLTSIFDAMYEKRGPNTWDYQWLYTNLKNNSLAIVPNTNLVTNIGFGVDATHTVTTDSRFMLSATSMQFPLRHPTAIIPLRSFDWHRVKDQLPPSLFVRILKKIGRSFFLSYQKAAQR